MNHRRLLRLTLSATVAVGVLAACGSEPTGQGGQPETITDTVDLTGARITVGSKDFTEQLLLGQITIQVLQAAGATVEDSTGQASTAAARQALESGATDLYWEYTGTGWLVILGQEQPVANPQQQFDQVAQQDLQDNDIRWLSPPAPANNTYALAVREEVYDEQSSDYDEDLAAVTTLSDLAQLVEQSPEKATLCVAAEFATRDDGLPGLEQTYGFELPGEGVTTVDEEDLLYPAVDSGRACNFGEVFRTDGRTRSLGLRVLADDKNFFPVYNPALTLRADLIEAYPDLAKLFAPIAESLDEDALQEMTAAVDVDGRPVRDVAQEFLEEQEFLNPQQLTK